MAGSPLDKYKSTAFKIPKLARGPGGVLWKLVGGKIEFYSDKDFLHDVNLEQHELQHLKAGGRLVVVHGCGAEIHVKFKLPTF